MSVYVDRIDWDDADATWDPDMEEKYGSSSEENETKEINTSSDEDSDEDYQPPICVR